MIVYSLPPLKLFFPPLFPLPPSPPPPPRKKLCCKPEGMFTYCTLITASRGDRST